MRCPFEFIPQIWNVLGGWGVWWKVSGFEVWVCISAVPHGCDFNYKSL